jgi:hypothetical protein
VALALSRNYIIETGVQEADTFYFALLFSGKGLPGGQANPTVFRGR